MANISRSDRLFISASAFGTQFYNFKGCGMDSLKTIIDDIRSSGDAPRGMVTVTVRNATQGWAKSQSVYIF